MSRLRSAAAVTLVAVAALMAVVAIFGANTIPGPGVALFVLIGIAVAVAASFLGRTR